VTGMLEVSYLHHIVRFDIFQWEKSPNFRTWGIAHSAVFSYTNVPVSCRR
jgi:hypothetical protein